MMKAVENEKDLWENIIQVEKYLTGEGGEKSRTKMIELIQWGHNFVCYEIDDEWHFVPSRYIGYRNNNLRIHDNNRKKHLISGTETNLFITKVLNKKPLPNEMLEKAYNQFCLQMGIPTDKIHKRIHKFWELAVPEEYRDPVSGKDHGYTEGKIIEFYHKRRERNPKLIQDAKREFKANHHGKLFCEICGFDFSEKYGEAGGDFIEVHHIKPVSEMSEKGEILNIGDLILVCSNCHSIIHNATPCRTVNEMKKIITD